MPIFLRFMNNNAPDFVIYSRQLDNKKESHKMKIEMIEMILNSCPLPAGNFRQSGHSADRSVYELNKQTNVPPHSLRFPIDF